MVLRLPGILRYGILFAAVLYLWNFFRSYMLFLMLALLAVGPFVSGLLLWAGRDVLWAQAVLPDDRVGKDTAFPFDIMVHNPRRFAAYAADVTYSYRNVFTDHTEQRKQHIWITPVIGSRIGQQLSSRYAGRVEVQIDAFVVYDLFRMFSLQDCARSGAQIMVWPAFAEAKDEELYSCVEGFPRENETKRRGTDYSPDYEVREYIPGDGLKSIHWKLSAKQGRLMVRERLAAGRDKINVLLPLGEDRKQNDLLIENVYALGRLLLRKEYPVQLYWQGRGETLREYFTAEEGELENALCEILSDCGLHRAGEAEAQMAMQHPGESYILIQTGAYQGAYIR